MNANAGASFLLQTGAKYRCYGHFFDEGRRFRRWAELLASISRNQPLTHYRPGIDDATVYVLVIDLTVKCLTLQKQILT